MKIGVFCRLFAAISMLAIFGLDGLACDITGAKEPFTEFYILGPDGRAEGYPAEFVIQEGKVVQVKYDDGREVAAASGTVILEVVNRELAEATYRLMVTIDGQPATVNSAPSGEVEMMTLAHQEVWRRQIDIVPHNIGDDQRVDFTLLKDGVTYLELYILIDVRSGG